jgi:hypothetical protein
MTLLPIMTPLSGIVLAEQAGLSGAVTTGLLTPGVCSIQSGDQFVGGGGGVVPASTIPQGRGVFSLGSAEPQITSGGTVIAAHLPPLPASFSALGQEWTVKPEFHLTLLGFASVNDITKQLKAAGLSNSKAREALKAATEEALQGLTFHVSLRDEWRMAQNNGNRSLIVMAECPETEIFYQRLAGLLKARHNIEIGTRPPPAHVTVYTGENGQAIGIPSEEELAARTRLLNETETAELNPIRNLLWPSGSEVPPPSVDRERIRQDLQSYGTQYGLRGLEGRLKRGLDPAGMLAVPETRALLVRVVQRLGGTEEDLLRFTNDLHDGGMWRNSGRLGSASEPVVRAWFIAAHLTRESGDLDETTFVADYRRIVAGLGEAAEHTETAWEEARRAMVDPAQGTFRLLDDPSGTPIPYSEVDAHYAMAIAGHRTGIVREPDSGILFVGADALDYAVLESMGLRTVQREDRGRLATFYVDSEGREIVKQIGRGFCIVLTGDLDVARRLARTAV